MTSAAVAIDRLTRLVGTLEYIRRKTGEELTRFEREVHGVDRRAYPDNDEQMSLADSSELEERIDLFLDEEGERIERMHEIHGELDRRVQRARNLATTTATKPATKARARALYNAIMFAAAEATRLVSNKKGTLKEGRRRADRFHEMNPGGAVRLLERWQITIQDQLEAENERIRSAVESLKTAGGRIMNVVENVSEAAAGAGDALRKSPTTFGLGFVLLMVVVLFAMVKR